MKKYSQEQIQKAISYWRGVLSYMQLNESNTSSVLNALEKQFGKEIYNNDMNFIPTNESMAIIFDILNKYIFNNRLPKINVSCLSESEIQKILNNEKQNKDASNFYALFLPIPDWKKISYVNKNPPLKRQYLIINVTNIKCNLSFAINLLCHEMIHYLDTIKGDILFKCYIAYKNGSPQPNEHLTKIFQDKSNMLNKNNIGLTIIPDGNNENLKDLCELSAMRMKRLEKLEEEFINTSKSSSRLSIGIDNSGNLHSILF